MEPIASGSFITGLQKKRSFSIPLYFFFNVCYLITPSFSVLMNIFFYLKEYTFRFTLDIAWKPFGGNLGPAVGRHEAIVARITQFHFRIISLVTYDYLCMFRGVFVVFDLIN